MRRITFLALMTTMAVSACQTTQPEAPVIVIPPENVQTCVSVSTLQKVVIPAETKMQTAITMIDNPPYAPIESRVERTIVVKPAQVIYVNQSGNEVIDICEDNIEIGVVGPGEGSSIDENGNVILDE